MRSEGRWWVDSVEAARLFNTSPDKINYYGYRGQVKRKEVMPRTQRRRWLYHRTSLKAFFDAKAKEG